MRVRILSGESGLRLQQVSTTLPFRGLAPSDWSLDVGSIMAVESADAEEEENPFYETDIGLVEKDPDRAHASFKMLAGEDEYKGFRTQRDLDIPGDVDPRSIFLLGSYEGATSLFQVLPDSATGPLLRVFSLEPITGLL